MRGGWEWGWRAALLHRASLHCSLPPLTTTAPGTTTTPPQVAPRILSVGSERRALALAEYLSAPAPGRPLFMLESSRGFLTITGRMGWGVVEWAEGTGKLESIDNRSGAAQAVTCHLCPSTPTPTRPPPPRRPHTHPRTRGGGAAGRYLGVPLSIVVTHMGLANADFVVRECRAVVPHGRQMAVVRLGTCGALQAPARLGTLVVASPGAVLIRWAGRGGHG